MEESRQLLRSDENSDGQASSNGISVPLAALFLYSSVCGTGVLTLPNTLVKTGWAGIPTIIACGIAATCTGYMLSCCWMILRKRYSEYHGGVSDPYAEIGLRAAGKWGMYAVRISVDMTSFGIAVVSVLLLSENLFNLMTNAGVFELPACYLILITGATLTPLTWLRSPKDFWLSAVVAGFCTAVTAILIIVGVAQTSGVRRNHGISNPTFSSFSQAFGTVVFAFGGMFFFPSIQVDMKKPENFHFSVVLGLGCVLSTYLAVSVTCFAIMGDAIESSNILNLMRSGWVVNTALVLISGHMAMSVIMSVNVINQDMDKLLQMDDKCSFKRCLIRSAMMLSVIFVGLSVPKFGIVLTLVGGTTIAANTFILPPLFYMLLSRSKKSNKDRVRNEVHLKFTEISASGNNSNGSEEITQLSNTSSESTEGLIHTSILIKVLLCFLMTIGAVGGITSSYFVIRSLADGLSTFTVPCYVNWTAGNTLLAKT